MKKLSVHVGVHKTATTHVQSRLKNTSHVLSKYGVLYIGPEVFRGDLSDSIYNENQLSNDLMSAIADAEHVLISEENILGLVKPVGRKGLYPNTEKNMSKVIDYFNPLELNVYITIRQPDEYFVSSYCEYLRHFRYVDFNQYTAGIDVKRFSWITLIKRLQKICGSVVKVSIFEKYLQDEEKYLARLSGVENIDFAEAEKSADVKRSKFSTEEYELLKTAAGIYSPEIIPEFVKVIDSNVQRGGKGKLSLFTPEDVAILRRNYANDIAVVDSNCILAVNEEENVLGGNISKFWKAFRIA